MTTQPRYRSESGVALVVTLGIMALLLVMALGFASIMRIERVSARNFADSVQSRYVARAGLERALAQLKFGLNAQPYGNGLGAWFVSVPASDEITYLEPGTANGDFLNIDSLRRLAPDPGEPWWVALVREYEDPVAASPRRDLAGRFAFLVIPNSVDLNAAGNLSSASGDFSRNEGWTTSEVDLGGFLGLIGLSSVPYPTAEAMARDIVRRYRYGSDGGVYAPGVASGGLADDNRNNYDWVTNQTARIPGALADRIDNDGDGQVDESNEGVNDPAEYDPVLLLGTNRVVKSVYDLYELGYLGTPTQNTAKENYRKLLATGALTSYDENKGGRGQEVARLWEAANTDARYDPMDAYEEYRTAFAGSGFGTNDARQLSLNLIDFIDDDSLPTLYTNQADGVVHHGVEETPLLDEVWISDYMRITVIAFDQNTGTTTYEIQHGLILGMEYVYPSWRSGAVFDADIYPRFKVTNFSFRGDGSRDQFFPVSFPSGSFFDGAEQPPVGSQARAQFNGARPGTHKALNNEFVVFLLNRATTTSRPSYLQYSFDIEVESRREGQNGDIVDWSTIRFGDRTQFVRRPVPADGQQQWYVFSSSADDPRVNSERTDWTLSEPMPTATSSRLPAWIESYEPSYDPGPSATLEGSTNDTTYAFYVKNAPLSSPGELGRLHRGEPWRTIRFDTTAPAADLNVLDRFTTAYDREAPVYGRINVNTDNLGALRALFGRLQFESDNGSRGFGVNATDLAQAVIDRRPSHGYQSLAEFAKSVSELYDHDVLPANPTDFEREELLRRIINLVTVRPTFTIYAVGQSLAAEESKDPPNEWAAMVTGEAALRAFVEYDPSAKKLEIRDLRYLTRPLALD